ncbi:hypothetical protein JVT61DRAFT_13333 [Boletus reticuloceps]|uniref:Uncharacterized protein n=1 Tax=Boletus reticuloceps TaxID=495285 RepID=A0A8I2YDH9_9AGAM|nr:hypothetical protein JVT61DRAFT_13333 [Boletus reticuloceps]
MGKMDIQTVSLEPKKNGLYMNHIQWEENVTSNTSILYNGNPHFHYMRDHSEVQHTIPTYSFKRSMKNCCKTRLLATRFLGCER